MLLQPGFNHANKSECSYLIITAGAATFQLVISYLTSLDDLKILNDQVLPTVQVFFPDNVVTFQDDNFRICGACILRVVHGWWDIFSHRKEQQNPNLNPTGNLWDILEKFCSMLRHSHHHYKIWVKRSTTQDGNTSGKFVETVLEPVCLWSQMKVVWATIKVRDCVFWAFTFEMATFNGTFSVCWQRQFLDNFRTISGTAGIKAKAYSSLMSQNGSVPKGVLHRNHLV